MERTGRRQGIGIGGVGGRIAALVAAAALVGACGQYGGGAATAPPATAAAGLTLEVRQDASLGAFVAGKDGKSLYVFTVDFGGATSACVDECAANWPPLTVARASDVAAGTGVRGAIGTITRADGPIQVTLGGAPLYYFSGDAAAGDVNGQGFGDVWFLASPSGGPVGGAGGSPGAEESPSATCGGRYCY